GNDFPRENRFDDLANVKLPEWIIHKGTCHVSHSQARFGAGSRPVVDPERKPNNRLERQV
ncbi:MAG: hypothetical protein ACK549_09110, partial [Cyanobacteriota bacterium]